MSKELKTETNETAPRRKKVSVKQIKLSDLPVGAKFEGTFKGFVKGDTFRKVNNSGEIVESALQFAIFENNGEKQAYVADKGFVDAISMSQIKEGMNIEVVKQSKEKIGKGREMNRYDIYV